MRVTRHHHQSNPPPPIQAPPIQSNPSSTNPIRQEKQRPSFARQERTTRFAWPRAPSASAPRAQRTARCLEALLGEKLRRLPRPKWGMHSKSNRRGYACVGPCFHLPGIHFSTGCWSHGQLNGPLVFWGLVRGAVEKKTFVHGPVKGRSLRIGAEGIPGSVLQTGMPHWKPMPWKVAYLVWSKCFKLNSLCPGVCKGPTSGGQLSPVRAIKHGYHFRNTSLSVRPA